MSSADSFLMFLYNGLMNNITLILCILFVILVINVIAGNFVLILVIVILLFMAYRYNRMNQSLTYGLEPTAERFDGSQKRVFFNPVTSYGAVSMEQPMDYMYGQPGLGDPSVNPHLMGNPGNWDGRNKHIRLHHTGAPSYISNRPPTDVPSCQQVICPPYINELWNLKDIYLYNPSINTFRLNCWKCIDTY